MADGRFYYIISSAWNEMFYSIYARHTFDVVKYTFNILH